MNGLRTTCALAVLQVLAGPIAPDTSPYRDIEISPGQPGERLQINFPVSSHAGPSRGTYWLTGNERIKVDVQLSVDVNRSDPVRVVAVAVIDGVQVPIRLAGRTRSRTIERTVIPGRVDRFNLLIDAGVSEGTHWASLIFWQADGQRFPGWSFTVVKNGSVREPAPGNGPFRMGPADETAIRIYLRQPAERLLFGRVESLAPASDGSAVFDVHLAYPATGAGARAQSHALVAFLDGAQVPFARASWAPTVTLDPGRASDGLLTLRNLPGHQRGHLLTVFLVTRERPSGEGIAGTQSDWLAIPPRQLGGLMW